MPHASLRAALVEAKNLTVMTLKQHDVWSFDDGTHEVIPYDVTGDPLGDVSHVSQVTEVLPHDAVTVKLPLVKQKPHYIGVLGAADDPLGSVWLSKARIYDLILHPNNVAEFTVSKNYALSKNLALDGCDPVSETVAEDLIPDDEVKMTAAQVGTTWPAIGTKPKYLSNLAQWKIPGGAAIAEMPVGDNKISVEMAKGLLEADYSAIEEHVVAHYAVDPASGPDTTGYYPSIDLALKCSSGEIQAVTLPLNHESPKYLDVFVNGKLRSFGKSTLEHFAFVQNGMVRIWAKPSVLAKKGVVVECDACPA